MITRTLRIVVSVLCLVLVLTLGVRQPQSVQAISITSPGGGPAFTDGFTYQGYMEYMGLPANGYYDFVVSIWTAETLGIKIATSQSLDNQYVDNGIFSFNIYPDIGASATFTGDGLWIEVKVKPAGGPTYTTMARQPITAVPYAWSLRPGALIRGSRNSIILEVENMYTGGTLGGAIKATGSSPTAPAIAGYHTGDGPGIYGSTSGAYPAVEGMHNGSGDAVGGFAIDGAGLYGRASDTAGYGVVGMQNGAYREQNMYWSSGGMFGGRNGVIGLSNTDMGIAVIGRVTLGASNYAWAGQFYNNYGHGVSITAASGKTGLVVSGGSKSAVVPTDEGDRLLYSEESTEVWFSDYGFGQLVDGEAVITIDPLYAQTVNLDEPYHVFVEVYGDAGVYVTDRTAESFRVVLRDGVDDVEFSYKILATRLGFEGDRLEPGPDTSELMQNPDSVEVRGQ